MLSFIDKFSILYSHPFGFVVGNGTTSLLGSFSDEIFYMFDQNLLSIALFLDISKAFQTVNHDIVLNKLNLLDLPAPFYDVLNSFLLNRSQTVVIDSHSSSTLPTKAVVPQGSVISPLHF